MTRTALAHPSLVKQASKAVALFGLACMPSSAMAASIGINFLNLSGDDNSFQSLPSIHHDNSANFTAADVAGAPGFAQANWNQMRGDWSGLSVNNPAHANLVNSAGDPVTNLGVQMVNGDSDLVNYDSSNLWASGVYTQAGGQPGVTANDTLMNGYLDDGGSGNPIVILDLKYDGEAGADGILSYSIVIYVNGDQFSEPLGRYWLEDNSTFQPITDLVGIDDGYYDEGGPFVLAGSYAQTASPQDVSSPEGNYIVFEGITADIIRVRGGGNDDDGGRDYGRAPINGLQIVANVVPEPSTSLIAVSLGFFAAVSTRRRS